MTPIVMMGVAGCGKSSVGLAVAQALGVPLIEGDDFHTTNNVEKMRAGIALTDADRSGWLDALGTELAQHPVGAVLTCSALKRVYRERLRAASPGLRFAHLELGREVALGRVAGRGSGHFFKVSLVDSQFAALENPRGEAGVLSLDANLPVEVLARQVVGWSKGA